MSTHGIREASRSTIVRVKVGRPAADPNVSKKKPLVFSPWKRSFFFRYEYSLLLFRSTVRETDFRQYKEIMLTCLGRSSRIIRKLLHKCRTEYLQQGQNKTAIFKHRGGYWKRTASVVTRPVSTIVLAECEKHALIKDMDNFLDERTQQWYENRSLPYRRGYILHGPPGTRKSSLSLAMAGRFDLDIYVVDIATVNNNSLGSLFSKLPTKCVVLVKDVDAANATCRRDIKQRPVGGPKGVTLSCLVNTLDGVASQEGRVLIMTTNHIEKLDKALIRPERIDRMVEFRLADVDILTQLFGLIFKQTTEEVGDSDRRCVINTKIEQQATVFSTNVPHGRLSPAEVLSFLLQNRDCPTSALNKAEE